MMRHVIWDFDGTLFDTYPYLAEALGQALELHGAHEERTAIAERFMDCESAAIAHFADKYALGEQLRRDYFECKRRGDLSMVRPFPGAREACQAVIDAGGHNYILTHRDDTARDIVAMCGMSGLFREIVTSANGFPRKPDPTAIRYLMERYGMDGSETMIVGDRELEVELGRRAGIVSCFFDNGTARCDTRPDITVRSLSEIADMAKGAAL